MDNRTQAPSTGRRDLYRTLWRWHFYAGVFCLPFVMSLSLSGAIYLFKPQFEQWADRSVNQLTVTATRALPDAVIATARRAYPDARFMAYRLPESARDAVVVSLSDRGERVEVYVDPYQNTVLKTVVFEHQLMRQVRAFHGELLAGSVGSVLVELAACWAIVLVITGLYLWWPVSAKGLAGVIYPRLQKGGRVFWRDLHAVVGVWLSALILFLLVTGLPWALVWGSAFKEIRQWRAAPINQDWTQTRAQEQAAWRPSVVDDVALPKAVIDRAHALQLAHPVEISVAGANYKISSQTQNRPLRADVWLNAEGAILTSKTFADKPLVDRVIGVGIAAHEGQLLGGFNVFLGVCTALGLVVMSVSGAVMWWRRRPAGTLGAPRPLPAPGTERVVIGILLCLGVVLPVVGMSLIVLWLLEFALLRRWPASRQWLGLP